MWRDCSVDMKGLGSVCVHHYVTSAVISQSREYFRPQIPLTSRSRSHAISFSIVARCSLVNSPSSSINLRSDQGSYERVLAFVCTALVA